MSSLRVPADSVRRSQSVGVDEAMVGEEHAVGQQTLGQSESVVPQAMLHQVPEVLGSPRTGDQGWQAGTGEEVAVELLCRRRSRGSCSANRIMAARNPGSDLANRPPIRACTRSNSAAGTSTTTHNMVHYGTSVRRAFPAGYIATRKLTDQTLGHGRPVSAWRSPR